MKIPAATLNRRIVIALLLIAVFGQRLVLPFGDFQCPILLLAYCLSCALFAVTGQLRLQRRHLLHGAAFFGSAVACVAWSSFYGAKKMSANSFLLLVALYAPYLFAFGDHYLRGDVLEAFRRFMVAGALLSVLQFVVQLAGVGYVDIFSVLPQDFVQQGFATSYPISYGSHLYKSNGFLFLEPSFTSQFIALAAILEYLGRKRLLHYLLYALGFLCTFSGTGMLLLGFFLLVQLVSLRNWKILGCALVGVAAACVALPGYMGLILSRAGEFNSEGSSGFIRFVAPVLILYRFLTSGAVLYGMGPGTVDKMDLPFVTNFTALPKVVIEYGVITGILFLLFVYRAFVYRRDCYPFTVSLFFMYLFLAGNLLNAQMVIFCYLMNAAFTGGRRPHEGALPAKIAAQAAGGAPSGSGTAVARRKGATPC